MRKRLSFVYLEWTYDELQRYSFEQNDTKGTIDVQIKMSIMELCLSYSPTLPLLRRI